MPATWTISYFPACEFHLFLSHCDEDRKWLVFPLFERLRALGLSVWLDRHDYPYGTDPYEALREEILKCRHVVYLVTDAMLSQGRGWPALEKAYAGLLQDGLFEAGFALSHVEFPLFFLPVESTGLLRSVWEPIRSRGIFAMRGVDHVEWAAQRIVAFVAHEQRRGLELAAILERDERLRKRIIARKQTGLIERITGAFPV